MVRIYRGDSGELVQDRGNYTLNPDPNYKYRNRKYSKPLPRTVKCIDCNVDIEVGRRGPRPQRCEPCRMIRRHRNGQQTTCPNCHQSFTTSFDHRKYCSDVCREEYQFIKGLPLCLQCHQACGLIKNKGLMVGFKQPGYSNRMGRITADFPRRQYTDFCSEICWHTYYPQPLQCALPTCTLIVALKFDCPRLRRPHKYCTPAHNTIAYKDRHPELTHVLTREYKQLRMDANTWHGPKPTPTTKAPTTKTPNPPRPTIKVKVTKRA